MEWAKSEAQKETEYYNQKTERFPWIFPRGTHHSK